MFKVGARAILELGAELISSDIIAFYELIKNAFDAGSRSGAEVRFEIVLRRNVYLEFRRKAQAAKISVVKLKEQLAAELEISAPEEARAKFQRKVAGAETHKDFVALLDSAYATMNQIVVSDEGSGMSKQDLLRNYLVVGTASRKREIDAALKSAKDKSRPPYLGEKGIGRLSAMRLGETLRVETARNDDRRLNVLDIDWSAFDNVDSLLDEIDIAPTSGGSKPTDSWSGTRIIIGRLASDWTLDRLRGMAEYDFARLTDPYASGKRRPRMALFWNGTRVPIADMDRHLLTHEHASIAGHFYYESNSEPRLDLEFVAINLGFEHPREEDKRPITFPDLVSAISGTSGGIPPSALENLGPFSFEIHWFNRRLLAKIDGIGDRETVRKLQRRWSSVLLFRDGFRVLPYGDEDDDWLSLDRKALGSQGYLLNKSQLVGRVNIGRLSNPDLIDQTNREGLRVVPEQEAFVGILGLSIDNFREFLTDVQKRHKGQPLDLSETKNELQALQKRTKNALDQIRKTAPQAREFVEEVQLSFAEITGLFEQAKDRIAEVESESRQMVQMAGIGLLVEVVAHELARSTENALSALDALHKEEVPQRISGLLESLRAEMKAVNKRIRVLDPLSVSGRQRRENFDLIELLDDLLSGHEAQFKRHDIKVKVKGGGRRLRVRAVKGMLVQIFENLISNSIYWLDLRSEQDHTFEPVISITIEADPLRILYEDNGHGIAKENKEKVFRAFFSLKEKTKRRGLGLFIARECAEYHGGTLVLDDHGVRSGRLNRFVLELPDEVLVS